MKNVEVMENANLVEEMVLRVFVMTAGLENHVIQNILLQVMEGGSLE